MKPRDRLVLAGLAMILVIGAVWLLLVSPERSKVNTLAGQIAAERSSLSQAQVQLASARESAAVYVTNVHADQQVNHAIPTSPAESQLIKTIVRLAGTQVDFKQLDVGGVTPTGDGPVALGLTFNFQSNYGNLQSFLSAIDALTTTDGPALRASGRLFTIQSVSLGPVGHGQTKATIIADVYQQPTPTTGVTGATATTGTAP